MDGGEAVRTVAGGLVSKGVKKDEKTGRNSVGAKCRAEKGLRLSGEKNREKVKKGLPLLGSCWSNYMGGLWGGNGRT